MTLYPHMYHTPLQTYWWRKKYWKQFSCQIFFVIWVFLCHPAEISRFWCWPLVPESITEPFCKSLLCLMQHTLNLEALPKPKAANHEPNPWASSALRVFQPARVSSHSHSLSERGVDSHWPLSSPLCRGLCLHARLLKKKLWLCFSFLCKRQTIHPEPVHGPGSTTSDKKPQVKSVFSRLISVSQLPAQCLERTHLPSSKTPWTRSRRPNPPRSPKLIPLRRTLLPLLPLKQPPPPRRPPKRPPRRRRSRTAPWCSPDTGATTKSSCRWRRGSPR